MIWASIGKSANRLSDKETIGERSCSPECGYSPNQQLRNSRPHPVMVIAMRQGIGDHTLVMSDRESEIESCLAYTVLRDPDDWIGCPSTTYLDAFLHGVRVRRDYAGPSINDGRISGVLDEPVFYKQFVDATGHPTLNIKWVTAIEMTNLSLDRGFTKLKDAAMDWHRKNGLNTVEPARDYSAKDTNQFWNSFARCPAMYMGDVSGWTLYCFLNGMKKGGDWLNLHAMPRLDEIFGGITRRSERAYGSSFAAFRVYKTNGLLEWVGLPDNETAN